MATSYYDDAYLDSLIRPADPTPDLAEVLATPEFQSADPKAKTSILGAWRAAMAGDIDSAAQRGEIQPEERETVITGLREGYENAVMSYGDPDSQRSLTAQRAQRDEAARREEAMRPPDSFIGAVGQQAQAFGASFMGGAAGTVTSVTDALAIGYGLATGQKPEDLALYQWGENTNKYWQELVPERVADGFFAKFGSALGSVTGFVASAGATGAVGRGFGMGAKAIQTMRGAVVVEDAAAAAAGTTAVAEAASGGLLKRGAKYVLEEIKANPQVSAVGAAVNFGSAYREAKEMGYTDNEALVRAAASGAIGTTEAVGVGSSLLRIDKITGGAFKNMLFYLGREAGEEFTQETGSNLAQGFFDLAYNNEKNKEEFGKVITKSLEGGFYAGLSAILVGTVGGVQNHEARRQWKEAVGEYAKIAKGSSSLADNAVSVLDAQAAEQDKLAAKGDTEAAGRAVVLRKHRDEIKAAVEPAAAIEQLEKEAGAIAAVLGPDSLSVEAMTAAKKVENVEAALDESSGNLDDVVNKPPEESKILDTVPPAEAQLQEPPPSVEPAAQTGQGQTETVTAATAVQPAQPEALQAQPQPQQARPAVTAAAQPQPQQAQPAVTAATQPAPVENQQTQPATTTANTAAIAVEPSPAQQSVLAKSEAALSEAVNAVPDGDPRKPALQAAVAEVRAEAQKQAATTVVSPQVQQAQQVQPQAQVQQAQQVQPQAQQVQPQQVQQAVEIVEPAAPARAKAESPKKRKPDPALEAAVAQAKTPEEFQQWAAENKRDVIKPPEGGAYSPKVYWALKQQEAVQPKGGETNGQKEKGRTEVLTRTDAAGAVAPVATTAEVAAATTENVPMAATAAAQTQPAAQQTAPQAQVQPAARTAQTTTAQPAQVQLPAQPTLQTATVANQVVPVTTVATEAAPQPQAATITVTGQGGAQTAPAEAQPAAQTQAAEAVAPKPAVSPYPALAEATTVKEVNDFNKRTALELMREPDAKKRTAAVKALGAAVKARKAELKQAKAEQKPKLKQPTNLPDIASTEGAQVRAWVTAVQDIMGRELTAEETQKIRKIHGDTVGKSDAVYAKTQENLLKEVAKTKDLGKINRRFLAQGVARDEELTRQKRNALVAEAGGEQAVGEAAGLADDVDAETPDQVLMAKEAADYEKNQIARAALIANDIRAADPTLANTKDGDIILAGMLVEISKTLGVPLNNLSPNVVSRAKQLTADKLGLDATSRINNKNLFILANNENILKQAERIAANFVEQTDGANVRSGLSARTPTRQAAQSPAPDTGTTAANSGPRNAGFDSRTGIAHRKYARATAEDGDLYKVSEDLDKLRPSKGKDGIGALVTAWENAIKAAGYRGYVTPSGVAVIFTETSEAGVIEKLAEMRAAPEAKPLPADQAAARAAAQKILDEGGTEEDALAKLTKEQRKQYLAAKELFGGTKQSVYAALLSAAKSNKATDLARTLAKALAQYNPKITKATTLDLQAWLGAEGLFHPDGRLQVSAVGELDRVAGAANHESIHLITLNLAEKFLNGDALPAEIERAMRNLETIRAFALSKIADSGLVVSDAFKEIAAMPSTTAEERRVKRERVLAHLSALSAASVSEKLTVEERAEAQNIHYAERHLYGLTDLTEFITEVMSNPEFQRALNNMDDKELVLEGASTTKKGLWAKVKAALRSVVFGGKTVSETSLLARGFDSTVDMLAAVSEQKTARKTKANVKAAAATDDDLLRLAEAFQSPAPVTTDPRLRATLDAELASYNKRQTDMWKVWAKAENKDLGDLAVISEYSDRWRESNPRPTLEQLARTIEQQDPNAEIKAALDEKWETVLKTMQADGVLSVACP